MRTDPLTPETDPDNIPNRQSPADPPDDGRDLHPTSAPSPRIVVIRRRPPRHPHPLWFVYMVLMGVFIVVCPIWHGTDDA